MEYSKEDLERLSSLEGASQDERLDYLISVLKGERGEKQRDIKFNDITEKKILYRSLCNIRPPHPIAQEYLDIEHAYLYCEMEHKRITGLEELTPIKEHRYIWRGDITKLRCDAIVNAANSSALGCFIPCHNCVDNAIHSAAGVGLRLECNDIMQGRELATGDCIITEAYSLPANYVIHTVGPIVTGEPTEEDRILLDACYRSCLYTAMEYDIKSIAFPSISTGEYHYPKEAAMYRAIETVYHTLVFTRCPIDVIFVTYTQAEYKEYAYTLRTH